MKKSNKSKKFKIGDIVYSPIDGEYNLKIIALYSFAGILLYEVKNSYFRGLRTSNELKKVLSNEN